MRTQSLEDMIRALHHRGPDDHDICSMAHVTMGHNRMSLPAGDKSIKQPKSNKDETIWSGFRHASSHGKSRYGDDDCELSAEAMVTRMTKVYEDPFMVKGLA